MHRQSMAWLAAWCAVLAVLLAASALLLSACAAPGDAARNPPRNRLGIPVDPVYGTPAPGGPPIF